jgi:spermidine synthase
MDNLILDKLTEDSGFWVQYSEQIIRYRSSFQEVRIVETSSFGRCLILDGKVQSAQADEFIYHEALVHPAMLCYQEPRSVFIAGGGEGATLREVLKHPGIEEVIMVDLDKAVVDLCREHLPTWHQGSFDDRRVKLEHEDARAYLENVGRKFDIIILDLSEPVDDGPSYLLFTREFYQLCMSRLSSGGVLVTQAGCPSLINPISFHSVTLTMQSVFEDVFPYEAFVPSFGSNWGFTLASLGRDPGEISSDELRRRMTSLNGELRFLDPDFFPAIFHLPKYQTDNMEKTGRVIRDEEPLIVL